MATALPAHRAAIVNLYSALFNRAPDASGLAFWAQACAEGVPLATITQTFMGTPEARASYPASQTSAQFVAAFYQTVFGRSADAGGLAFWTSALDAAGGPGSDAARATLAGQIVAIVGQPLAGKPDGMSDAAYAQTVADRALFANKAVVGDYVASLNIDNVALARQVLAIVTADPASVPIAKDFAANGGAMPTPSLPVPIVFLVTNADTSAEIISKLAAYAGSTAAVEVTGMDASKQAEVAAAIAKIASGGIYGVLGVDVAGYANPALATLAGKFSAAASMLVTGSGGIDTIALNEYLARSTINGGGGDDIFTGVVDATTPGNTTLSANHTIDGGAGMDTLNITTVGTVANALNGASVSSIEAILVQTSGGGSASLVAPVGVTSVTATGAGSLDVSNLNSATLILDGTTTGSNFAGHYSGGTNAVLRMAGSAYGVTLDGSLTTVELQNTSSTNTISSLVLGANVTSMVYDSNNVFGIAGMSGGAAGALSVAVTYSGTAVFLLTNVTSSLSIFDGSTSSGRLLLKFDQSVGTVKGGGEADTIIVAGALMVTGGLGNDIFGVQEAAGQASTIDLASLLAKMVTITDFSSGDMLSPGALVNLAAVPADAPVTGTLQQVSVTGATLYEATVDAAAKLRLLGADVPYAGFVYSGDTYLLVDNNIDGLGAGDMLVRLLGSPPLSSITYLDNDLRMA